MIEKYYVWSCGNRVDNDGFFDFMDAYEFAMEVGADEIEKTIWESEDAYENYEPASCFEIAWER